MNGLIKTTLIGAAVAATALTAAAPANAGGRWHHHRHYQHRDSGDLLAAGILGAAVGAVATGILTQPAPAPVYVDPYPRTYYPPAPVYRPAPRVVYVEPAAEPWTQAWYRDCSVRYRSFDPGSGTYLGYDGQRHFCNLN